jgi:hypothetical protein
VNPGKRKAPEGTGADATTRHRQPESYTDRGARLRAVATIRVHVQVIPARGFWTKAASGKVRPVGGWAA